MILLLRDADVFAPRALGLCNVLIGGGRILWIGPPRDMPEPPASLRAQAQVLDLAGMRLIPGLIDLHAHLTGGGGEAGFSTRVPPQPLTRFTRAGVTSVVGLLGTDDVARSPRELLASVHALREEGLNAWAWTGGYHLPPATVTGDLRTDLTFIEAILGIGEVAISDHRSSQPQLPELLRLAADAHLCGLMTGKAGLLHLHLGDGPRGLDLVREALAHSELPPRVFNPTHVNRRRALFEEAIALAQRGCSVDVTAFPVAAGEDAYAAAEAVERYVSSGAPPGRITVSSDAGGCLPHFDADGHVSAMQVGSAGALLQSLRELELRGMPLAQALPPFTSNPARLLRLSAKGRIDVAADADLVALDAGGAAHTVVIGGTIHVRAGQCLERGTFEAADASGSA